MARRKGAGAGMNRELEYLRPPVLNQELKEGKESREPKETRENSSPKGYRQQTDVYRKVSYFLTHDQADLVKKEADLRGMEISAFFRTLVDFYYNQNPLNAERVRSLMEDRVNQELKELGETQEN